MSLTFKNLFLPIMIGKMKVNNRIVATAHNTFAANPDNTVSKRQIAYYGARAKGGCGLIVYEATSAEADGRAVIVPTQPGLYDDRFIPGFKELTDEIHQYGAKTLVQLVHGGRMAHRVVTGVQPMAPSVGPSRWWSIHKYSFPFTTETPRALSVDEIQDVIDQFAAAAQRAEEAGFDGVELHASHGYLLSEFLSPVVNERTDQYGGTVEGRARIVIEIINEIQKRCDDAFVISIRINGADYIKGGTTPDIARAYATLLEKAGADLISVSGGFYGSIPATIMPMTEPCGVFVHLASELKRALSVPVVAVGRINDPVLAEEILLEKRADLIGMTRAQICDPELANKTREGRLGDIRRCISCNSCPAESEKDALAGKPMGIKCALNILAGREFETHLLPVDKSKKVVIIGGGPGGLKAAEVAAIRGHNVTLFEEKLKLGGKLRLAAMVPNQDEWLVAVDYLAKQMEKLDVDIRLQRATPEIVAHFAPDVVIVATGAVPDFPDIPGIEGPNVISAYDVFELKKPVGQKVAILGGQLIGCQTAEFLASQGKAVTVIEPSNHFLGNMYDVNRFYIRTSLNMAEVVMLKNTSVTRIGHDSVRVLRNSEEEILSGIDTIVVAQFKPNNEIAKKVNAGVPRAEVFVVGDAKTVDHWHVLSITRDAFEIADKI